MALISILFCIYGVIIKKHHSVAIPLLVGLMIRLIMVFLIHNGIIVEGDWDKYIEKALLWSRNGFGEAGSHFTTGAYFYSWIASLVFSLFGTEFTLMRLINCFLSATVIFNVYLIVKNVYNKKNAKIAAWIMALSPTAIIFSSTFCNREPLNIFLLTASIYYLLKWIDDMSVKDFTIWCSLFALNIVLHSGYIIGLVVMFPFVLVKIFKAKRSYLFKFTYLMLLGTLIFVATQVLTSGELEKFDSGGSSLLEKLNWYSVPSTYSRANYLSNLSIKSYFDLIWQGPLRMLYFLFAPFPWMIDGVRDIYGVIDSLFYWFIVLIIIVYHKKILSNQKAKLIFIFVILITAFFSLATLNYGTALRHRAKFFPIYICLISRGVYYLYNKLKTIYKHSG